MKLRGDHTGDRAANRRILELHVRRVRAILGLFQAAFGDVAVRRIQVRARKARLPFGKLLGAFGLFQGKFGIVEILLRDAAALEQHLAPAIERLGIAQRRDGVLKRLLTLRIRFRRRSARCLFQRRARLAHRRVGLGRRRAQIAGLERRDDVARLDHLSLDDAHPRDDSPDLWRDGYLVHRRHGPERAERVDQIRPGCARDLHRDDGLGLGFVRRAATGRAGGDGEDQRAETRNPCGWDDHSVCHCPTACRRRSRAMWYSRMAV